MKLNDQFIVHESNGEAMLVPAGAAPFSGIVRGNRTLGAVLTLLKKETTEDALVRELKEQFRNAPEGAVERDVKKALCELRKIGALDE